MSIKIFCRESFNNSRIKPMAERHNQRQHGSFEQVEISSCGLNSDPLIAKGKYPSVIACNITNRRMPRVNTIKDSEMQQLAEYFGVDYRKDFLNL